jgi:hypothetical protein
MLLPSHRHAWRVDWTGTSDVVAWVFAEWVIDLFRSPSRAAHAPGRFANRVTTLSR